MRRSIARSSSYEDTDSDDFPTVPWVTRALFEYVAPELTLNKKISIYDPACGRGHMLEACKSIGFKNLYGSDVINRLPLFKDQMLKRSWQYGGTFDYITAAVPGVGRQRDLLITNPPGKLATKFVEKMLEDSRRYVAVLCLIGFSEGGREHKGSRWERIYKDCKPTRIAVISARMPAAKGVIVQHRPVFRTHAWFFWDLSSSRMRQRVPTEFRWIPPEAQRLLERREDYE